MQRAAVNMKLLILVPEMMANVCKVVIGIDFMGYYHIVPGGF